MATSHGGLEAISWRNRRTGEEVRKPIRHVFLFVGADPETDWLDGCGVAARCGKASSSRARRRGRFAQAGRSPCPLETNVPGVFAVGDVRSGSVKRVGGAIGEGAAAVAQIHHYLAAQANRGVDTVA